MFLFKWNSFLHLEFYYVNLLYGEASFWIIWCMLHVRDTYAAVRTASNSQVNVIPLASQ